MNRTLLARSTVLCWVFLPFLVVMWLSVATQMPSICSSDLTSKYFRRCPFFIHATLRKDNFVVVRSVGWLKKGNRLRYMEVHDLQQIDGIWVPMEMSMTTKKGKKTLHKTVLKTSNVKFNQPMSEDDFTIRKLEKGL